VVSTFNLQLTDLWASCSHAWFCHQTAEFGIGQRAVTSVAGKLTAGLRESKRNLLPSSGYTTTDWLPRQVSSPNSMFVSTTGQGLPFHDSRAGV